MYPDFYYLFRELFGIEIPFLGLFKTFGFMVALAFLAAAYFLMRELKRKEEDGLIPYTLIDETINKKSSIQDILISVAISAIAGYKIIGLLLSAETASADPLNYIFSKNGSLFGGIGIALATLIFKFYENNSLKGKEEKTIKVKKYPHQRVSDIVFIAAIGGFAGAKIFNTFEDWDTFLKDPFGSLFSSSGLTFYGGLIVAATALYIYSRKINLSFKHLCDAVAPGLLLAYGIGRLGCQIAGDGDWGIYNSAYKLDVNQKVVEAKVGEFDSIVKQHPDIYSSQLQEFGEIMHHPFKSSFLPTWLIAYTYPNNVSREGAKIPNCDGVYCNEMITPVYPTPIYEFIACVFIFLFLWYKRKKWNIPLTMFGVYLIFNGLERYLIEKIRVNSKYNFEFINLKITQAEIISFCLFVAGLLILIWIRNKKVHPTSIEN